MDNAGKNLDASTVTGFGEEWHRFDQSQLDDRDRRMLFDSYFHIFPFEELPAGARGFDLGSGSGRWAGMVAPKVGHLHLIDASGVALDVARRNLAGAPNCSFHLASVDAIPFPDGSMDFGYSLGVLHHVPDTAAGLRACVDKLKPGAPFLLYLYYRFDNRPAWFRWIWGLSDALRRGIARLPFRARAWVCDVIALAVYWPLARAALLLEGMGALPAHFPLANYRRQTFYSMRTDALDRFGTRLERRFTRSEIRAMMESAGLKDTRFSDREPFWVAMGYKRTRE